jgi:crotonobetainyl-CoA:carnitine CoA-transferase CaiB-like acyl-CoA transferase
MHAMNESARTDLKDWPLKGLKVLDLGQIYNGAYAGFLLAHAGAEVVKVEPPRGDALRGRGNDGLPLSFAMLNTNKRGLVLDLKASEGKALLFDLVAEADVLLENYAPGAMDTLGCGAATLMEINPRLIYASSTGYGLTGPDRDNLAMDLTIQAFGGVMSINGPTDGPPLKAGLAICDFLGAVHLYAGITTALYERSVTGVGRMVEISMEEALYPVLASNLASLQAHGWQQPERRGNRHPTRGSAPYGVYPTRDGHIAIICVRDVHWDGLLELMDRTDLKADPRFVDQTSRAANEDLVDDIVAEWSLTLTKADATRALRERRVPAAMVRDLVEVTHDRHMHERGMLHWVDHPALGEVVLPSSPLRFDATPEPILENDPLLGEHTEQVLIDWLGCAGSDIDALAAAGAFGGIDFPRSGR